MDGHPPWANLPGAVLFEIVRRIPCAFERIHMRAVCAAWHQALQQFEIQPPPPLPGILLLRDDRPTFSCIAAASGGGGGDWCTHRVYVPDAYLHARYFGSYDGSWLFLSIGQHNGHGLFNLRNLQGIGLHEFVPFVLDGRLFGADILTVAATLLPCPIVSESIGAGVFTIAPPPPPPPLNCSRYNFSCWKNGSAAINIIGSDALLPFPGVEDVIYHDMAFRFLSPDETILWCEATVSLAPDMPEGRVDVVTEKMEITRLDADGRCDSKCFVARYLVESRGRLLMVARLALHPQSPAFAFRVFQLNEGEEADEDRYTWEELPALDGRMLFVGRGCSRSYEAADYPGLEAGVYFLDDRSHHIPNIPFQNAHERQYLCSDNGKWSGTPPQIRLYAPDPGPSNYSPPVWLIP
uniref:KIB1-4 beta-propeller domain-containing protein n=1 Tax=Leersia perrieri TaxID=77586 RepID=A0A0D9WK26_9ORYZ